MFFCTDEGIAFNFQRALSPDDERNRLSQSKIAKGYGGTVFRHLVIHQDTSSVILVSEHVELGHSIPVWVSVPIFRWLAPKLAQDLFKTVVGSAHSGPYTERLKRDELGIHANVQKVAEAGAHCQARRG